MTEDSLKAATETASRLKASINRRKRLDQLLTTAEIRYKMDALWEAYSNLPKEQQSVIRLTLIGFVDGQIAEEQKQFDAL
jgi:hypothetical protein